MKVKSVKKIVTPSPVPIYDVEVNEQAPYFGLSNPGIISHNSAETKRWRAGVHTVPWGSELREMYRPRIEDAFMIHWDYCWHKDTKIKLLDGRVVTIEMLKVLHDSNEEQLYTYSYDSSSEALVDHGFACGTIEKVEKTRYCEKLLEIEFGNGYTLKSTDDHHLYVMDGAICRKIKVRDLKVGDRLQSMYTWIDDHYCDGGYEFNKITTGPDSRNWRSGNGYATHKCVIESLGRHEEGMYVDHTSNDKLNNSPLHLENVTPGDHWSRHLTLKYQDPEYMEAHRKRCKDRMNRPEWREYHSELAKNQWASDESRQKKVDGFKSNMDRRMAAVVCTFLQNGLTIDEIEEFGQHQWSDIAKSLLGIEKLQKGQGTRYLDIRYGGSVKEFIDQNQSIVDNNHEIVAIREVEYSDWTYSIKIKEDYHNYFVV
ncbi:MAG: hypothetical protein GY861_02060, partial [bacterium]|nr:hypothetical protein [bacterium]